MKKKIGIVVIVSLILAIIGIIGMMIGSNSRSNVISSNCKSMIHEQSKEIFNKQFIVYEGVQRGSEVKVLIQKVVTNNNVYYEVKGKTVDLYIEIDDIDEKEILFGNENTKNAANEFSKKVAVIRSKINTGKKYTVLTAPNVKTGYICKIAIIEENNIVAIEKLKEEYEKEKLEYEKQISEQQKQLEKEQFWKDNAGYIIALCIVIVILVVVIIITFKKRKKKVENE